MDRTRCIRLTRFFFPPEERPEASLITQLEEAEETLRHILKVSLTTHQRDAMVCLLSDLMASLANAHEADFLASPLMQHLNARRFHATTAEFHRFCCIGSRFNLRMYHKRQVESRLFDRALLIYP